MIYDFIAVFGGACIVIIIAIVNDWDLSLTQQNKESGLQK